MKISLKNVNIEYGKKPKIAVSLIVRSIDEMIKEVKSYDLTSFDIIEWRGDYFDEILNFDEVHKFLAKLNKILNNKPIIFTFRTKNEGGVRCIGENEYIKLNKFILNTKLVDAVDIEYFMGESILNELILESRKNSVKVIISNHDFCKTPANEIIIDRLNKMKKYNPDILKVAFMPENKIDVLELMKVGLLFNEINDTILIMISMGNDGMISRFLGEIFNSQITFASINSVSAPGQVNVSEINTLLNTINKICN